MNLHTRDNLISFECQVRHLWETGELPSLIHLCSGNEGQLINIFQDVLEEDWVFLSHRGHYHALLKGMPAAEVMENIRNDRSMFIFSRQHRIYQSAILGGCCGIAAGVAKAIKDEGSAEHVWCFLGDGAVDGGKLYEAAMYVTGNDLPCTFVIENNDRQVDTSIAERRGPSHEAFQVVAPCIREYRYKSAFPHAGSGCSHQIQFKRTIPL